jgi:DNA-binding transcriptional LysR family regulator
LEVEQVRLYTIYDHPRDFPDWYVVRAWEGDRPDGLVAFSDDLAVLRAMLAGQGLTCIPRNYGDDPVIVETWL